MCRDVMLSGGVFIAWSAIATMRALSIGGATPRCAVTAIGIAIANAVVIPTRVSVEIE
jgi:hypothetical protein